MSDTDNGMHCDCECFEYGDLVRSKQNPHLTGQIIGSRNWESEYEVRLADGLTKTWWHAIEIEHDLDAYPPEAAETDAPVADNVVDVDFTKRRRMTAATQTEGAA